MKFNPIPLLTTFLLVHIFTSTQAQKGITGDEIKYRLQLLDQSFVPSKNIVAGQITELNRKAVRVNKQSFAIIQFENIPTPEQRKQLQQAGIELLDYVPNNAYTVTIKDSLSLFILNKVKARAVIEPTPVQKMQPVLASGNFPPHAIKIPGTIDLWISFPKTFSYETVSAELTKRNFDILPTDWQQYRIAGVRISINRLAELAALPFVSYVEAAPAKDQLLNNKSEATTRANVLQSSLPGGRNLHGDGVVVGIGDDANLLNHIDFTGRLINRAAVDFNQHGVHVAGTVGGAGIVREIYTGYAPKTTIISQISSNILANAPVYVQDYGMVITNNSYGNLDACSAYGTYDLYSRIMDQQAFQMPNLQHVFAGGNWNQVLTCPPFLSGFNNIWGSFQSAKNVISVGNTTELEVIHNSSSKGPTRDGRIKPEISAQGTMTWSTWPTNLYQTSSGTSMAAPAVSGGLALLYQRYRQLHSGANPKNGLMKALLCNGAVDRGNAGPDFSYGFGIMNLLRSVKMLENNNFINDSVTASGTNTHNITLSSSMAQLKVMLYWNDSAASVLASQTLVNDLDLEVSDPSAVVHLPALLDTVHTNVNNPATTGVDHVNNIEQVVIDNPGAGTYTFTVKGTTIPFAARHSYFLVYDTIPVSAVVTYPMGGEHFVGGDSVYINWEAYGNPGNDFTLQYSIDNGSNWININTSVAANLRQYKWIPVPTVATDVARIKLIHNGTGLESISEPFTIIGVPVITSAVCEGYITLNWGAVTGATDYEVMMLRGTEMTPVGTTALTTFTISGLSRDSIYWVTARARLNTNPGRRATAIQLVPTGAACGGTISDNDMRVHGILLPTGNGRKFTSTEFSNAVPIQILIQNLDNIATTGNIPVAYKIGTNPTVNETIIAPNIGAGGFFVYSFATTADFSAVGTYPVKVSVSYPGDPLTSNDTVTKVFKQLDNPFIDITSVQFLDDVETATEQTYYSGQRGMDGLDRYDFISTSALGRVRTFVNTGIAYSGSKALTLDDERYSGGIADSLKGTFNLQGYNVSTDDIRLDFLYKQHGQVPNNANRVWIRGSDQQPWIQVYDLYANQADLGVFKKSANIEVSDVLAANSQVFTSSFQVRWGQWGIHLTADDFGGAGYTFDNIRLLMVTDDIQMLAIDTPVVASCGLNNVTPVRVSVRNSKNTTINNIPVSFELDGGAIITETIPSIAGNATILYTFTTTADISAVGTHTIRAWVDLPSDSYPDNDTTVAIINNLPVINTFPYLENFELSNGYWYATGTKSSWEYGTPSSPKINRAASGSKAWKTSLIGNYNDGELSYLYSPCFDLTGMTSPTLSLSIALDLEDCGGVFCDGAYVQYSTDGKTWTKLGAVGQGTNWYNRNYGGNHLWSVQNYTRWHVATIPLPTGATRLRLRFAISSDPFVSFEGIGIDDIHIYDNTNGIYTGPPTTSASVNQPVVNGSNWIHFVDGGKLIASVNPNGQDLGSTNAQAYIYTGAVRINFAQYYHNRNITIKPTNVNLADSATVRFYFLDTETETLINATGCPGCSKPTTAYRLGVSKYSDPVDAIENGNLNDDVNGNWLYINSTKVTKVPFDKGYYAEFKVKDFSEFWLNNGGPNDNQTLPAELISFIAVKEPDNNVVATWVTASEYNTSKYEVQVAKGNEEYRQNHFITIGTVNATGNSVTEKIYQFTDNETNKSGVRYYRLKIIDQDGRFTYSLIRPVVFNEEIKWQVYPNPSSGKFNFVYQANDHEEVTVKIYDVNGKQVKQVRYTANGFVQKAELDIADNRFTSGMYLLEASVGGEKRVFRLLKQ